LPSNLKTAKTLGITIPPTVLGDPNAQQTMMWALGEVAGELQECSVYFGIVEYCIAAQRPDIARTYHAAKAKLNELELKSHLAAGLSSDAYIAMLPLLAQNTRELLGNRDIGQQLLQHCSASE
jgi:hypothetical protein